MGAMSERHLALFDFDGTLTTRDTMLAYCQHVVGTPRYLLGMLWLGPMLVAFKAGLLSNDDAKQRMLTHFLGGRTREELRAAAETFVARVEGWLRPEGVARLQWHLEEGHDVYLVSASLDVWLSAWASSRGLSLLSTEGLFEDDRFTGRLATANCHGAEKVRRVQQVVDPADYGVIHAYGDSSGDTEMLALAHEAHFKPFRS